MAVPDVLLSGDHAAIDAMAARIGPREDEAQPARPQATQKRQDPDQGSDQGARG